MSEKINVTEETTEIITEMTVTPIQEVVTPTTPTVEDLQAQIKELQTRLEEEKKEVTKAKREAKIVPTVSCENVKVVLNTANKELTSPIVRYWLIRHELATQQAIARGNIKSLQGSVQLYLKKVKTGEIGDVKHTYSQKLEEAEKSLKFETSKNNLILDEIKQRQGSIQKSLPRDLYLSYVESKTSNNKVKFEKSLKDFFKLNNVEVTPSLLYYFISNIGVVVTSNNVVSKSGNLITVYTEKKFIDLFVNLLGNLYLQKKVVDFKNYLVSDEIFKEATLLSGGTVLLEDKDIIKK